MKQYLLVYTVDPGGEIQATPAVATAFAAEEDEEAKKIALKVWNRLQKSDPPRYWTHNLTFKELYNITEDRKVEGIHLDNRAVKKQE